MKNRKERGEMLFVNPNRTNVRVECSYLIKYVRDGDEPMFYIYFNKAAAKGFLHFSEVGGLPIFPKPKKTKP